MTRRGPGTLAAALCFLSAGAAFAAAADVPRLAGTVVGPDGRSALIELGAQQHGVALGDDVAGWIVESIAPGHVVLSGPKGTLSLWVAAMGPALSAPAAPRPTSVWINPCGRLHGAIGRHDAPGCRAAIVAAGLL